MNLLNPSFFLGPYAGIASSFKSTPTPMIPRSEVDRLLADTGKYPGKIAKPDETERSVTETDSPMPNSKPSQATVTNNPKPQRLSNITQYNGITSPPLSRNHPDIPFQRNKWRRMDVPHEDNAAADVLAVLMSVCRREHRTKSNPNMN